MTENERKELEKALEILCNIYWDLKKRPEADEECNHLHTILNNLWELSYIAGEKIEATAYAEQHNWEKVGELGTAGLYTNGKLFVMCNGTEWFASKTPDASGRWARGWRNMLPAMRFADSK